jgi:hypothetical protein
VTFGLYVLSISIVIGYDRIDNIISSRDAIVNSAKHKMPWYECICIYLYMFMCLLLYRNEWNKRIQVLIRVLEGYIQSNDVPTKEITSECLFYDGFA